MKHLWKRARSASKHPLFANSLWMFSGQGLSLVTQAGYFIIVARLLGSAQYGTLVGAAAAVGLLSQYGAFGAGILFLRYVSPDHSRFKAYWGNILLSCILLGGVLVLLIRLLAPHLFQHVDTRLIVLLAVGDCVCGQLATATSQVFQAFERMRYTAILNMSVGCARMVLAFVMLIAMHHAGALQWATASLCISAATAVLSVGIVTYQFGLPSFDLSLFVKRMGEGFIFAISGSTTSLYNDVDKAMLAHYGLNIANGIYTMAYRVVDVSTIPIRSIHAAAFPRFFRNGAGADGLITTESFAKRLLRRTSLLGLAGAVAMFLAAPLIPLLVGKGFSSSVSALRWLCLIPFFRSFHLSAGDALAGAGRQPIRLAMQLIAAAGNTALNIYLIPRYSWRGAAFASLLTDGGLGLLMWFSLILLTRSMKKRSSLNSQLLSERDPKIYAIAS